MAKTSSRPVIVVAGGAGYLGRCTMDILWQEGFAPVCLDNYSTGHRFKSDHIPCFEVNLTDAQATRRVWEQLPPVSGVLHFAALALVPESIKKPGLYFRNNLLCTLSLAELAAHEQVPVIHSSSCSVYGIAQDGFIDETSPLHPISPYGESKRASENVLKQFCSSLGLRALNLRYFNPAGALQSQEHGEAHEPETHLIPRTCQAALRGEPAVVYGTQYPTPDGTCIRDFLHVEDLALGHVQALRHVLEQPSGFFDCVNLGSGKGYSVLEVAGAIGKILGESLEIENQPPRPGDPPQLVASIEKAHRLFDWRPVKTLEDILRSHLEWEKKREYVMKSV